MGLISSGIEKVRVFEVPAGIWSDGRVLASPRAALVEWSSSLSGKFFQVYANGRYAGTTIDCEQRRMLVQVPSEPGRAVRIEVFAVEPEEAYVDLSDEPGLSQSGSGRVRIVFVRTEDLPVDGTVEVYFDNGSGVIDYGEPLGDSPVRLWRARQEKGGFGLSEFGVSDFGYDCSAGIGFGRGSFGSNWFGIDAEMVEWTSEPLAAGVYRFGVKVFDGKGNESGSVETGEVTVVPWAKPAELLEVFSFDGQRNQLVLSVG